MFPLCFPVAYLEHQPKRKAIARLSDVEYRPVFCSAYRADAQSIDGNSIDTRSIQGTQNVAMILRELNEQAANGVTS
jgi:hypothetical protein